MRDGRERSFLRQRSVAKPHDVGVDHAWIDDDGKYVWVGTFRQENDGVHMLEYDTGRLVRGSQQRLGWPRRVFTTKRTFRPTQKTST